MDDLVVWLRQQLDEDERVARGAANEDPPPWHIDEHGGRIKSGPYTVVHIEDSTPRPPVAEHIARHDPARVLLEVEAKRRILDALEDQRRQAGQNSHKYVEAMRSPRGGPADDLLPGIKTHGWTLGGRVEALEEVVKLLALPYSDHPGYREEWAP